MNQPALEKSLAAINQLLAEGKVDGDTHSKMTVCLALEFSAAGEHVRAASLVLQLPDRYLKEVQRKQMEEDPNFAYVSYTLALNLVQNGLVSLGPAVKANQPAASA